MSTIESMKQTILRGLAVLAAVALMAGCANPHADDLFPDKNMIGVTLSGVGHYGKKIGIPDFSVNGARGPNVPGWGGGGKTVCCVLLPRKITKPMMVTVRWKTCDVGHIVYVNGRRVDPNARCKEETHEATVPINFAVEPGKSSGLYVHFLPGHRVEVWVSRAYPEAKSYPGPAYPDDPAPDYAPLPGEKPQPATKP